MYRSGFSILAASLLLVNAALADGALRFGIVPQGSAVEVLRAWEPVAAALSEAVGRPVVVETERDIPTFEACVHAGVYDIAYMNPYHYVVFSGQPGYRAIAHRDDQRLSGLIVVRADAPYQSLRDLDGLRIAFPSPAAFAASILQRAELTAAGVAFEPVYTRSHSSGYLAVARGALPAAAGVNRTLAAFAETHEEAAQLRVVHRTAGYTPHAIAVSDQVDEATAEALAQALTGLHDRAPDALLGLAIRAFARPAPDAYDDVRALSVPPAETGINMANEPPCPSD